MCISIYPDSIWRDMLIISNFFLFVLYFNNLNRNILVHLVLYSSYFAGLVTTNPKPKFQMNICTYHYNPNLTAQLHTKPINGTYNIKVHIFSTGWAIHYGCSILPSPSPGGRVTLLSSTSPVSRTTQFRACRQQYNRTNGRRKTNWKMHRRPS